MSPSLEAVCAAPWGALPPGPAQTHWDIRRGFLHPAASWGAASWVPPQGCRDGVVHPRFRGAAPTCGGCGFELKRLSCAVLCCAHPPSPKGPPLSGDTWGAAPLPGVAVSSPGGAAGAGVRWRWGIQGQGVHCPIPRYRIAPPHPIPLPARLRGADAAFTDRGVGAAPRGPPPPGRGGGISRRGRAGAAEARSQRRGPGAATCRPLPSLPLPSPSRSAAARPLPGARGAGPRRPPWRRSRRRRAQRGASGSRRP